MRLGRSLVVARGRRGRAACAEPPTSPITDRDYAIELYDGVAIGNTRRRRHGRRGDRARDRHVGHARSTRPRRRCGRTTDTDTWSWDYHLDYLNALAVDRLRQQRVVSSGARRLVGADARARRALARLGASRSPRPTQTAPIVDAMPSAARATRSARRLARAARGREVGRRSSTSSIGVAADLGELDVQARLHGAGVRSLFDDHRRRRRGRRDVDPAARRTSASARRSRRRSSAATSTARTAIR